MYLLFILLISLIFVYIIYYSVYLYPYGSIYLTIIRPIISSIITSFNFQRFVWFYNKLKSRTIQKKPKIFNVFISLDNPQSYILLQCIKLLIVNKLELFTIKVFILPIDLCAWDQSSIDTSEFIYNDSIDYANLYNFQHPIKLNQSMNNKLIVKSFELLNECELLKQMPSLDIINKLIDLYASFYSKINDNDDSNSLANDNSDLIYKRNLNYLQSLGYYGPGMLEFEGEWYQSNRLYHLETRLGYKELIFNKEFQFHSKILTLKSISSNNNVIEVFFSFRSPYSQIIIPRLIELCNKINYKLTIRVMMPMVMRGLQVHYNKVKFIALDCAREARLWNIKFGTCCDPITPEGKPVMRALDCYIYAKDKNKEVEYINAFASLVWGEGVDFGTNHGIKQVLHRAGLSWNEAKSYLQQPHIESQWQKITTDNRDYIYSRGLWGVPCIKCDDLIVWGQDKLWKIEQHVINKNK